MNTKNLAQGSDEWHEARSGRLTASVFASAMGVNPYQSRQKLYAEILGYSPPFTGNDATAYGTEMEPYARFDYEAWGGVFVEETGFWKGKGDNDFLGCSPDGLVDNGLVEFKCPYSQEIHTDVPAHYMAQVQGQMAITERQWCHYVSWAPDDMSIFLVGYSPEYWAVQRKLLKDFWGCVMLKEKPGRRKKPVMPEVTIERLA